jgi:hypothetical protein
MRKRANPRDISMEKSGLSLVLSEYHTKNSTSVWVPLQKLLTFSEVMIMWKLCTAGKMMSLPPTTPEEGWSKLMNTEGSVSISKITSQTILSELLFLHSISNLEDVQ